MRLGKDTQNVVQIALKVHLFLGVMRNRVTEVLGCRFLPDSKRRIHFKTTKRPKFIISLTLAALFIIILLQSMQVVTSRLFFWEIIAPQIILITLTMLIGLVAHFFAPGIQFSEMFLRVENGLGD